MARFMTIQRKDELTDIATALTRSPWQHCHAGDLRITDPFRSRREGAWQAIRDAQQSQRIDAVLVSPFYEGDMVLASYVLAPLRAYRRGAGGLSRIKVALILPSRPAVTLTNFTRPVKVELIRDLSTQAGLHALLDIAKRRLPAGPNTTVVFVEDGKRARNALRTEVRSGLLGDARAQAVDFDEAHDLLLHIAPPAVVLADTVEEVDGPQNDRTGLGLYLILRTTPRLQDITRVLYSVRLYDDPNLPLEGGIKAFDEVLAESDQLQAELDGFLRNM
jgi:hypothetical protein